MLADFRAQRARSIELVASLEPWDLERAGIHERVGRLTVNDLLHELRAAEDVYDINLFGNFRERAPGFFTERFANIWIDGNDLVSLRLHVGRDTVAGAQRTV